MELYEQFFTVFFQTIKWCLTTFLSIVWKNLPQLLELKDILDYFTPLGMLAAVLGIPLGVLSAVVWFVKNGRNVFDWFERNVIDRHF
jgi:hypothetical protein